MKKSEIYALLVISASFLAGFFAYSKYPATVAGHWDAGGELDGYVSRFSGAFFMPILAFAIFVLFLYIPKIDPLKTNIEKFRKYYDGLAFWTVLFLAYVYSLTIAWNFGARFNFAQYLAPAFAALYYYMGIMLENAKRNWFVGIKTPWTISSDAIWEKTHRRGAKLFKDAALIASAGFIFYPYAFFLTVVPVIAFSAYLVVYSYLEFQKENQKKNPA